MLADVAADDPRVAAILDDASVSHLEAARRVSGLGVSTSESSVRRARRVRGVSRAVAILAPGIPPVEPRPVRRDRSVPTWRAGITYDEEGGEFTTVPRPAESSPVEEIPPEEAELFAEFGLDPGRWRITRIRRSRWQTYDERWLEAFRVGFEPRRASARVVSEEEAHRYLSAYPAASPRPAGGGRTLMVPVGDLQLGKPDGSGTAGVVERFGRVTAAVAARLETMGGVESLVLPWLGDCLEGHVAQGGRNVARLDTPVTEQARIYRRLMWHQIATLAPLASRVLLPVVGGNHDETLRVQAVPVSDSWALDGASAVADLVAMAPDRFGHVSFLFPDEEELGVTVNLGDEETPYVVHCTHGHVARSPDRMVDWWRAQTHGRQEAGAADLLLTAHWHHLRVEQTGGGRVWLQIPAMDGGSDWFRRKTGDDAASGVVSMEVVGGPVGFADLRFHS